MDTLKGILIALLFLLVAACAPLQQNKMATIGIIISPDEYGINVLKGAQLAVKEAGLERARLVVEESSCDVRKADALAEKLITIHKAQVIFEGVCPKMAGALMPLAAENKVVLMSAVSTAYLTSPFFFRTIPDDGAEAVFAADFLKQQGHTKTATAELFSANAQDFGRQLEAIADTEATAIYAIADSPASAKLFLRQRQERGLSIKVYGSKWFKNGEVLKLGEAAEGLTIITPRLGNVGFITKYKELYGKEPDLFAASGYDAYKALALAIQQGARTGEEMKEALLTMEFAGSSGIVNFDENGNIAGSFEVYVVKEGKFEPQ